MCPSECDAFLVKAILEVKIIQICLLLTYYKSLCGALSLKLTVNHTTYWPAELEATLFSEREPVPLNSNPKDVH